MKGPSPFGGKPACQKTSLWETDSPDTGEVALAPEGERWPEGPEGESLAFARNLRACVKLSPPPPAGGAPSQRGPRSFSTICLSPFGGAFLFQHSTLSGKFRQVYRYRRASSMVSNSPPSASAGRAAMVDLSNGISFCLRHSSTCTAMFFA